LEEYHGIVARFVLYSLVMSIARAYPTDQIDLSAARKKELAKRMTAFQAELKALAA
jgi:hypothetical protein